MIPVEIGQMGKLRILDLNRNRLSGSIPQELGTLARLKRLELYGNQLNGKIPRELGQLRELQVLRIGWNQLSGSVPSELGHLDSLERLDLYRNQLNGEIPRELGKLANVTDLNIGRNFLSGTIPPELGDLGRLVWLNLERNQLVGGIPPELGKPKTIESINLADNRLTGRVPPQLGALVRLSALNLSANQLSGPIPPELGRLGDLQELTLFGNNLSGPIPEELGELANLTSLNLGDNGFSGPLPGELAQALNLESLDLRNNALSGRVPAELGNLTQLTSLILADNPALAGPLPLVFTALEKLERFMAGGTGLCRPANTSFDTWFGAIPDRRIVRCAGGAAVYLTQTIQSWDDPVPLLAGEPALLRVFVTAPGGGAATMPSVRATFFGNDTQRHTVRIVGGMQSIPTEVFEGDLDMSANAEIPGWVITPGLEMVIEVDPEGTLATATGVTKRIPDSGRMVVDVRSVPPFRLTLVPLLSTSDSDASVVKTVTEMASDPHNHELLRDLRTLLPIATFTVKEHEAIVMSTPDPREKLNQLQATRLMEGGTGYWLGIFVERKTGDHIWNSGIAILGGSVSVSLPVASTIAHELGHNLSLDHAPCGQPGAIDPWFPHEGGLIGAWGYDFGKRATVNPNTPDVMSYCGGRNWISDYFYRKAFRHRHSNEVAVKSALAVANHDRTLLLWGGRDKVGVPYLDPAFVVDAVPSLPPAGEDYTIEGATADGMPVFSYTFDMPVTADAEGEETNFVFALPLQPEWTGNLASITLSGPGGSATLDGSTDRPMAILRDLQTGQVSGFLSDLTAEEAAQAAEGAFAAKPGTEAIFSRGIPDLR